MNLDKKKLKKIKVTLRLDPFIETDPIKKTQL